MIRYVVLFPDGSYSDGPRRRPVPLEKAKLWKTRGHVTQHLAQRQLWREYPPGCVIVRLTLTATQEILEDVSKDVDRRSAEREQERRAQRVRDAQQRLESARAAVESAESALEEATRQERPQ